MMVGVAPLIVIISLLSSPRSSTMPVPSFLASFADKAQSAINASPLAGHTLPTDSAAQNSNEPGGYRSHALGSLQNQLRAFGQQYA